MKPLNTPLMEGIRFTGGYAGRKLIVIARITVAIGRGQTEMKDKSLSGQSRKPLKLRRIWITFGMLQIGS